MKILEQQGSLELVHWDGDDQEPETYLVRLVEDPKVGASLHVAREWRELNGPNGTVRPNGSQAVTIKQWYEKYL